MKTGTLIGRTNEEKLMNLLKNLGKVSLEAFNSVSDHLIELHERVIKLEDLEHERTATRAA